MLTTRVKSRQNYSCTKLLSFHFNYLIFTHQLLSLVFAADEDEDDRH